MKWAVVILITLGLLAALSASVLVNTLRTSDSGDAKRSAGSDIDVLLAAKSLPAMSVLTSSLVQRGTAPQNELPERYLTNPIQAVGRVLAVPIVEGQILTDSCFVTQGTGAQLAASLPEGMRAVSVTLSSTVETGGLLYPGCIVDVLVTFRLRQSEEGGQAISTTLLREVQVLAVEGASVVSREKDPEEKKGTLGMGGPRRSAYGRVVVTLMVDPRQAEALQLAVEHGKVSLAIRNPLDKSRMDTDATVLSQGKLAKLGEQLDPTVFAAGNGDRLRNKHDDPNSVDDPLFDQDSPFVTGGSPAQKMSWLVNVIRGVKTEEESFDVPND